MKDLMKDPTGINQFVTLLKDLMKIPAIQSVFRPLFENVHNTIDHNQQVENALVTSDLRILPRLTATEGMLGLNDYSSLEKEEHELLTLPEQISQLNERLDIIEESCKKEPVLEPAQILTTKTEIRAHSLVEHLKHNVREKLGNKFLSSEKIVNFLKYEIDEKYQVAEGQNVRQTKKEVLAKALELFPNHVFLNQKLNGRKNVRMIYKQ